MSITLEPGSFPALAAAFVVFMALMGILRWLRRVRRFRLSLSRDASHQPATVLPEAKFMLYFKSFPFRSLPRATVRDFTRGTTHGVPWVACWYIPNGGPAPLLMVKAGPVLPALELVPNNAISALVGIGGGRFTPTDGTALDGRYRARTEDPQVLHSIPPFLVDALPGFRDGVLGMFFEHGILGIIGGTGQQWIQEPEQRDLMAHRLAWIAEQRVVPLGVVAPPPPVTIDAFFSREEWPWPT